MSRLRNAPDILEAARKGVAWLLSRANADGSFRRGTSERRPETNADRRDSESSAAASDEEKEQALVAYCYAPLLFGVSGQVEEAARVLQWLAEEMKPFSAESDAGEPAARVRMAAWIAWGAHICGRYDLSRAGTTFLASCQGKSLGGVYGASSKNDSSATYDMATTACAGMAFLACGRLDLAWKAGQCLADGFRAQSVGDEIYVRFDRSGRPVRQFPEALARFYVIDRRKPGQEYEFLGVPALFLAELSQGTGDGEFLEIAQEYFRVAEGCASDIFESLQSAILAWAAGALYAITRRRRYYEIAERMAAFLSSLQDPQGFWPVPISSEGRESCSSPAPSPSDGEVLGLTAKMSLVLLECLKNVQ